MFECRSEQDRIEAIDKAFDYRGDVTLQLSTGDTSEGYMSNRDATAATPVVEIYVKNVEEPRTIPYVDIKSIAFSGRDPASGKSWQAWVSKKESERVADMERIRKESEEMLYQNVIYGYIY